MQSITIGSDSISSTSVEEVSEPILENPDSEPYIRGTSSITASPKIYLGKRNRLEFTKNDFVNSHHFIYDGTTIIPKLQKKGKFLLIANFFVKASYCSKFPTTLNFGYELDGLPQNLTSRGCLISFIDPLGYNKCIQSTGLVDLIHLDPLYTNAINFTCCVSDGVVSFTNLDLSFVLSQV